MRQACFLFIMAIGVPAAAIDFTARIESPLTQLPLGVGTINHFSGGVFVAGAMIGSGTALHTATILQLQGLIAWRDFIEITLPGVGTFLIVGEKFSAAEAGPAVVIEKNSGAELLRGTLIWAYNATQTEFTFSF
ncbi:MAG TPA: hypothetical protein VGB99_04885 [Acidobacteriota bacterium]